MQPFAAKTAQRPAVTRHRQPANGHPTQTVAIERRCPIGKAWRGGQAVIQASRIIAGLVNEPLPRQHVVQCCGNARIADPVNAVLRRDMAGFIGPLITDHPIGGLARVW